MLMDHVASYCMFLARCCLAVLLLVAARGIIWLVNFLVVAPFFDPLKWLPGPDGSAFQSHFSDLMDPAKSPDTHKNWANKYGRSFRFHGYTGHDYRLMLLDLSAVSYVLNSPTFEKPWQTRSLLSRLLGRGIFAAEGAEHRLQRKIIGPAFSTQAVKAITPIFHQKAEELKDRWERLLSECEISSNDLPSPAPKVLDVAHWLSRAAFDIIGLSGFDYCFDSLQDESEEVYLAYRQMFDVAERGPEFKTLLRVYFPWLESILPDEETRVTKNSLRIIHKAGKKLVEAKRAAILAEKTNASDIEEKDLLSLLIKSNLSSDPSKRLSDRELLDQLSTFLFAGSDSTALAISWCLHYLSKNPELQARLRDELLCLPVNSASYSDCSKASSPRTQSHSHASASSSSSDHNYAHVDAMDALPFLDAVIRETLRVCSPVHAFLRTPTEDADIPVSSPIVLRDGTVVTSIHVRKGTYIHIPIEGLNTSEDIWGEDATTFNPDRWLNLPENARSPKHPGLANLMTFSLGPHSCPGWKFSLLEIKMFLAVLLPHFVFAPAEEIAQANAILVRPYVYDKFENGYQLPMQVSQYHPT